MNFQHSSPSHSSEFHPTVHHTPLNIIPLWDQSERKGRCPFQNRQQNGTEVQPSSDPKKGQNHYPQSVPVPMKIMLSEDSGANLNHQLPGNQHTVLFSFRIDKEDKDNTKWQNSITIVSFPNENFFVTTSSWDIPSSILIIFQQIILLGRQHLQSDGFDVNTYPGLA